MTHRINMLRACLLACVLFVLWTPAQAQTAVAPCTTRNVTGSDGVTRTYCDPVTAAAPLPVSGAGAGGATTTQTATTSGATSLTPVVTTAPANSLLVKSAPANLYSVYAANTTATAGFLVIVNQASVPATGALTGVIDFCVLPPNGQCSINSKPGPPTAYSTGIVALITSATTPFTYTTGTVSAVIHAEAQ